MTTTTWIAAEAKKEALETATRNLALSRAVVDEAQQRFNLAESELGSAIGLLFDAEQEFSAACSQFASLSEVSQ